MMDVVVGFSQAAHKKAYLFFCPPFSLFVCPLCTRKDGRYAMLWYGMKCYGMG